MGKYLLGFNMKTISKVINLVKRCYISLAGKDNQSFATAQVSYFGKASYIETIYPYGLSANAPVNTFALVFNVMGQEENLAGIPYGSQERFKPLKEGEVIVGSPKTGSYVKFMSNGDIDIYSKGNININTANDANITAANINFSGKVNLGSGGAAIARVGDEVLVGSSTGTITSGSSNNTSN